MLKKLSGSIREYALPTVLTPIFMVGEAVMEVLIPYHMADLIDLGIKAGDMNAIRTIGAKMLILVAISLLCGMLGAGFAATASVGYASNLRHDMYEKIQSFSFANIDKFSTAGLVTRMTTDVTNVQMAYMMMTRMMFRAPSMLIFAMIMAFRINNRLAFVFFITLPFLAVGLYVMMTKAMPMFERMFKLYDKLNNVVQENLRGIRVVKAFVREEHEKDKFREASGNVYKTSVSAETTMAFMQPLMQICMYGCNLLISWLGAKLIIRGSMTTGELMSFITYIMQILMSLMMFSMVILMLTIASAAAKRIVEVLDEKPDITDCASPLFEVADGSVDFEDVSFGYGDSKDCLSGINLHIKSGETIGVIGGTGSGKSSLVQLIPRLYDVRSGVVKVGGTDVREIALDSLRGSVAMVLQKNVLFTGTVESNLRWGKEDASPEEMKRACEIAQADSFIMNMPGGYGAEIEQGGTNVSGGQRQRLCIARALIGQPKILILDDSTSAVDTATERSIREGLRQYMPETTKIIIAQRISSVRDADRIIVIDNGMINGLGTHEELLAGNAIYREVYESQNKGGDFDAPSKE
jgi:ATP-binding cassette subfamily B protein